MLQITGELLRPPLSLFSSVPDCELKSNLKNGTCYYLHTKCYKVYVNCDSIKEFCSFHFKYKYAIFLSFDVLFKAKKKGKIPLKYSPLNGKQSSYCLVPYHHERVESSSSFAVFDDDVASAADNSAACN